VQQFTTIFNLIASNLSDIVYIDSKIIIQTFALPN